MAAVDNSFGAESYKETWSIALQEELDEPTKWEDICKVTFTNTRILHNPYLTDATIQTGTRGCPYYFQNITITDDDTTISTYQEINQFIDRADLAQLADYATVQGLGRRQGVLIKEAVESAVYAGAFAGGTDFGTEDLAGTAGGTTAITVSSTNIDDIIRGIKKTIRVNGGESLANRNGIFIVWRPADLEILEGFMQANGFVTADTALKGGATQGIQYMGVTHYSSNLLTATHVVAGVKKGVHLGILRDTYGQIVVDEKNPMNQSGISVNSRVDYAVKVWNKMSTVIFDVNVA